MFPQISAFFDDVFSNCPGRLLNVLCTFNLRPVSTGYSTQHCHLKMLDKWKKCVDKGKVFGTLSKAFGSRHSRMEQLKFVEDWLSRPYHFKFFKGCLPQILLGPFLNSWTHLIVSTMIAHCQIECLRL